jgi:DNA-binding XRE family transcriptional regulator
MTLKEYRQKANLTQEALAVKAAIGPAHYARIERCGGTCNKATAAKIASALNEKLEAVFPNFSKMREW